jgi:putative oxidoreductase
MFDSQDRRIHFGLLVMRLGLTAVLFLHALPKLFGELSQWKNVGMGLSAINVGLPPVVFGFAILLLETLGAVSFVFGYFFRTACVILFTIFGLYFFIYLQKPGYDTLMLWSLGLAAVFFGLIYVGPGRYSIAVKLEKK